MSDITSPFSYQYCPSCGKENSCRVNINTQNSGSTKGKDDFECWCMGLELNDEEKSILTKQERDKRCWCQACLSQLLTTKSEKN